MGLCSNQVPLFQNVFGFTSSLYASHSETQDEGTRSLGKVFLLQILWAQEAMPDHTIKIKSAHGMSANILIGQSMLLTKCKTKGQRYISQPYINTYCTGVIIKADGKVYGYTAML